MTLELKRQDFHNIGFLAEKEISKILKKLKIDVDQKDYEVLLLSSDKDGDLHSYKDLLKLILPDNFQKLIDSNLLELEELD